VHLNANHPASRLGIVLAFVLGRSETPFVVVEHRVTPLEDVIVPRSIAWALPRLYRRSRQRAARIVAVAAQNADDLVKLYRLHPQQITVVNNGADLPATRLSDSERAALRRSLGVEPDASLVLTPARLNPNKGHRFLCEAVPKVLAGSPSARFVFAGDGYGQLEIETQIARLGIGDAVKLLGFRADVTSLMQASDVFVLPSLAEGFSLALIEALACGLICVATHVGGAPEVIEHGVNGYLVPPSDATALADTLGCVLRLDATAATRMRSAAHATASLHSLESMCDRQYEVYARAVARRVS
jgi:glycosyltransferase involved in cell wall biosynthesis